MESFHMISVTACFLGIVITIFSRLYPSEKFEKQMKTLFSLVFLISVLTSVLNGNLSFPDISETVVASNSYYTEIYDNSDDYFIRSVENNISMRLKAELNSRNIFPDKIQTSVNISDDNSISISEVNVTVTGSDDTENTKSYIYSCIGDKVKINIKLKEEHHEHQ